MEKKESPEYLRMSLAAAMTLGLRQGRFYRNARLYCINLLLTYDKGCSARCAYCGLSNNRPGAYAKKSFIRVAWPQYRLDEIIEVINSRQESVKRICISMLTNHRSVSDTKEICKRLRSAFDIPVSLLISPTILISEDLEAFKAAGADKIGVAIDLATKGLFNKYRGNGVNGPHKWERYWQCLGDAIRLFGKDNGGSHFITGMGETEKEMCEAIQRVRDMGGTTHLFSFFPEAGSSMAEHPMPPMAQYRRIQVARYLIDNSISETRGFRFDHTGQIIDYGLSPGDLEKIINTGEPFRTSGCKGYDGVVACNRPYANSRPGPDIRNFPFKPEQADIDRIKKQADFF
ncbi:MAG: radical SAM protein [Deltaproteobacteria bacterium]|nr:radical SAM protein [Deltaproteobacteria bacterium]